MMKQKIFTVLAVLSLGLSAAAQEALPQQPQVEAEKQHQCEQQCAAKDRARKQTDRMVEEYQLNKKQAAALLELNEKYATKFPQPRPGGPRRGMKKPQTDGTTGATAQAPAPDQKPAEAHQGHPKGHKGGPKGVRMSPEKERKIREAYDAELKKILTKKQFAKYEANKARPHHRHH